MGGGGGGPQLAQCEQAPNQKQRYQQNTAYRKHLFFFFGFVLFFVPTYSCLLTYISCFPFLLTPFLWNFCLCSKSSNHDTVWINPRSKSHHHYHLHPGDTLRHKMQDSTNYFPGSLIILCFERCTVDQRTTSAEVGKPINKWYWVRHLDR